MLTAEQFQIAINSAQLAEAKQVTALFEQEQQGLEACWDEPVDSHSKILAAELCLSIDNINTILGSKLYFEMIRLSGLAYNSALVPLSGRSLVDVSTIPPNAPTEPVNDPGTLSIPIPKGQENPFTYTYTGTNLIKAYYGEFKNSDGSWTLDNTLAITRDSKNFEAYAPTDVDGLRINDYRLTLVFA